MDLDNLKEIRKELQRKKAFMKVNFDRVSGAEAIVNQLIIVEESKGQEKALTTPDLSKLENLSDEG